MDDTTTGGSDSHFCTVIDFGTIWVWEASMKTRVYRLNVFFLSMTMCIGCSGSLSDAVEVEQGILKGAPLASGGYVFKGVPFAAPPIGDLRWQPPQAPATWEGSRDATAFGASCMQHVAGSRPPWTEEFMVQGAVSEDCLYLNIWTHARAADAKHPVLVYIHGGGFTEGSGSVALYDGTALAQKGIVVVTINYRLGVFGLLSHPDMQAESPEGAVGNFGLLDQVEALKWVQKNIAAFGGDPSRVTIAGQSAGAMSVYLLTVSPLATGLFHGAVLQSGPGALAAFGLPSVRNLAVPLEQGIALGEQWATSLGAGSLNDLRALSADSVMQDAGNMRFPPVIDGQFLEDDVESVYASGKQNKVPILSGMNADEASAFPGYGQISAGDFVTQAQGRFGDLADEFVRLYPAETDEQAGQVQITSNQDFGLTAMRRLASEQAATGSAPIFLYYFDQPIPWPDRPEFQAFHTGEVPYVFDNLALLDRPWEDTDRMMAKTIAQYWVNFVRTGDPNGEGVPTWPAFQTEGMEIMVLQHPVTVQERPSMEKAIFWNTILSQ